MLKFIEVKAATPESILSRLVYEFPDTVSGKTIRNLLDISQGSCLLVSSGRDAEIRGDVI